MQPNELYHNDHANYEPMHIFVCILQATKRPMCILQQIMWTIRFVKIRYS